MFPQDWYWLAQDGRLFSSARSDLVSETDASYMTWRNLGHAPTVWPRDDDGAQTDAALHDVLAPYGLMVSGYTAPVDMPALRQSAFATAMEYGNAITAKVTGTYSDVEARTWPLQRAQADTVLAGGELPPDALLRKLATRRGMDVEAFALVVQHKAQVFETIADVGQGLRLGAEGLLSEAIETPEKLAAAVEALRAQTLAEAAQLGLTV